MARSARLPRRLPVLPIVSGAVVVGVLVLVVAFLLSRVDEPQQRGGPLRNPQPPPGGAPPGGETEGLLTFRGNATRTYHGEGPVPLDPVIGWRTPAEPMCSVSFVGLESDRWCGTGWTGQPNVVVLGDSVEVREGAYDGRYHFVDGLTGQVARPPLQTRDLAKGSATTDPDGYPLYYVGSRDGRFRIVALDRLDGEPEVLWSLHGATSVERPLRNDDWDGAALVVDDVLFVGGENGWLYVIRLNRGYAEDLVRVRPEIVAAVPGWDEELLRVLGDEEVSIENSVSLFDGTLYFANSGGLVQGWDVSDVLEGGSEIRRVFRFWTGDDTDASIAIDELGALYVASEYQRGNQRSHEVGQLMKLDPARPDDPLVWSIDAREVGFEGAGGSWSTPALYADLVIFTTAAGRVLAVERDSGDVRWERQVGAPAIGSPVVVGGVLIQGDCRGDLWAWDISDPTSDPALLWKLRFSDCIESTPAVWRGWIYLGTRQGYLYGLTERGTVDAAQP